MFLIRFSSYSFTFAQSSLFSTVSFWFYITLSSLIVSKSNILLFYFLFCTVLFTPNPLFNCTQLPSQYVWQNDSFLLLLYLIMIKFLLCSTLASLNSFSAIFSHSQQLCKKFFKKKIVLLPNFYTFKAYQGIAPFKIISLIHVIFQK